MRRVRQSGPSPSRNGSGQCSGEEREEDETTFMIREVKRRK